MSDPFHPQRWHEESAYAPVWGERARAMLDLLESSGLAFRTMTYAEYGCGPRRPFGREAAARGATSVLELDQKAWSEDVRILDLDDPSMPLPTQEVAVLSGVVEYLLAPEATFERLASAHDYILFSYHPMPALVGPSEKQVQTLNFRLKGGWRNHLTSERIVDLASRTGYLIACSSWRGQLIFLVKSARR